MKDNDIKKEEGKAWVIALAIVALAALGQLL